MQGINFTDPRFQHGPINDEDKIIINLDETSFVNEIEASNVDAAAALLKAAPSIARFLSRIYKFSEVALEDRDASIRALCKCLEERKLQQLRTLHLSLIQIRGLENILGPCWLKCKVADKDYNDVDRKAMREIWQDAYGPGIRAALDAFVNAGRSGLKSLSFTVVTLDLKNIPGGVVLPTTEDLEFLSRDPLALEYMKLLHEQDLLTVLKNVESFEKYISSLVKPSQIPIFQFICKEYGGWLDYLHLYVNLLTSFISMLNGAFLIWKSSKLAGTSRPRVIAAGILMCSCFVAELTNQLTLRFSGFDKLEYIMATVGRFLFGSANFYSSEAFIALECAVCSVLYILEPTEAANFTLSLPANRASLLGQKWSDSMHNFRKTYHKELRLATSATKFAGVLIFLVLVLTVLTPF